MKINFRAMKTADFVSSAAAVLITSDHAPFEMDDSLIIAMIDAENGRLVDIALFPLAIFDIDGVAPVAVARPRDSVIVRLVAIADAERTPLATAVLEAMAESFENIGTPVVNRILTPKLATGEQFTDLCTGETGTLPDPAHTPPALASIIEGRGPLPDLEAIANQFAELPPVDTTTARTRRSENPDFARETLTRMRDTIVQYARTYDPEWTQSGVLGAEFVPDERTRILDRTREGAAADIAAVIEISGSALDALLGLANLDIPAAARIYTHISNQLEYADRARMLCVAAALYYVDGSPYYAHEALIRAIDAIRRHEETTDVQQAMPIIGRTLVAATEAGVEIEVSRGWLALGTAAAKRYGIEVPEFDLYPNE